VKRLGFRRVEVAPSTRGHKAASHSDEQGGPYGTFRGAKCWLTAGWLMPR